MGCLSLCWLRAFVSLFDVLLNVRMEGCVYSVAGFVYRASFCAPDWPWFARDCIFFVLIV
jgi:hypothetical protein